MSETDRRAEFRRLLKRVAAVLEISRYDSTGRQTLHVSRVGEDRISDGSAPPLPDADRVQAEEIAFSPVEFCVITLLEMRTVEPALPVTPALANETIMLSILRMLSTPLV